MNCILDTFTHSVMKHGIAQSIKTSLSAVKRIRMKEYQNSDKNMISKMDSISANNKPNIINLAYDILGDN